jgi:hypothetical protein
LKFLRIFKRLFGLKLVGLEASAKLVFGKSLGE